MEFVEIAGTEINSSRIGLGTWAMGGWLWGGSDRKECVRTIYKAFDNGVNLIDTAPIYGFGLSEEIVGEAVSESGMRDELIIATKVGLEWERGGIFRNSLPERIRKEIDDSLRRLRTDRIDLYQIHWPDPL
ncbi:MAG: aldo/keto reductase, partial [Candidatus Dadabacteria bacterium]|nr:aldo/keto reductase [Candidatus Dadabacteria bacterium]